MTTQAREPERGLTFEKVWAMFQESDRRMRKMTEETDRRIQKMTEEADRRQKEIDRILQETAREMKETDRRQKETDKQIGKLGNRFGELAEHLVSPNIVQKFNALGFHFDDISSGLRQVIEDEGSGKKIAEFDILLENGESIIGVEVKTKPSYDDVGDHVQRLKILRLNRDRKGDKRKIHGALAGAVMPAAVKAAALKAGLYVIKQTGDTVKIEVPEGFIPKTW
ncbi:MAG: hypothetical protein LBU13_07335 [Synergistaceae bacterium]|jgi:Skp family chaperone for outer membrane proteins|nr:hypothetical protein [Synergistaceae bacterium]